MSAYLLGLGFRADMGTCVRKLVWLKLIDACEEDGSRIFPAIATIARAAQCSTRQAQREMKSFQDIGLLRLVKKGGNGPRSTNEYALDLDMVQRLGRDGWDKVAEEVGLARAAGTGDAETDDAGEDEIGKGDTGKSDTVSPFGEDEKGDTGDTGRVTPETAKGDKLCHPTPPYPSIDPSEREARADADGQEGEPGEGGGARRDDPRKFEARVKRLASRFDWPRWSRSSTDWAVRNFAALTDAERAEAEAFAQAYIGHCGKGALSIGVYFGEKKWRDLPDEVRNPPPPATLDAPAFGPLWSALRLREILTVEPRPAPPPSSKFIADMLARDDEAGRAERLRRQAAYGWPGVAFRDSQAASRKGAAAKAEEAWLAGLMEPVPVGSAAWDAWRDEFARRGWPWVPDPGGQRVVYFPKGGPDGLEAFGRMVGEARGGEAEGRTGTMTGTAGQARKAG